MSPAITVQKWAIVNEDTRHLLALPDSEADADTLLTPSVRAAGYRVTPARVTVELLPQTAAIPASANQSSLFDAAGAEEAIVQHPEGKYVIRAKGKRLYFLDPPSTPVPQQYWTSSISEAAHYETKADVNRVLMHWPPRNRSQYEIVEVQPANTNKEQS